MKTTLSFLGKIKGRQILGAFVCLSIIMGILSWSSFTASAAESNWNMNSDTLTVSHGNTYNITGGNVTGNVNTNISPKIFVTIFRNPRRFPDAWFGILNYDTELPIE